MTWDDLRSRVRALFFPRRMEAELQEEMAAHLEAQTRKYIEQGMSTEEARRHACVDFGAFEGAKEECRDSRGISWLTHVAQDLRFALRMVRRAPGITGLIVLVLGLGMGANLATFSVTDAILLRMLPVKEPGSLFRMVGANANAYDTGAGSSYQMYREMQKRTGPFAALMAYQPAATVPIAVRGSEPIRLTQQTVSGNYFSVLGIRPVAGRLISPDDDKTPGQGAVAVISDQLWQTRFDKSERAIGSKLQFGEHAFDIIGVAPAAFFGVEVGKVVDVWTPISMASADTLRNDHLFWLRTLGRLKPGVSIAEAAAPMQAIMNQTMLEDVHQHAPPGTPKQVIDRFLAGMRIKGVPAGGGVSYLRGEYRQPLQIMMCVVALVLLIACSNVANLLLARGRARQQEIVIRLSLGAGRGRILQQLATEGLLLAAVSAGVGLLFAHWGTPVFVQLLTPSTAPAKLPVGLDPRLLVFTAALLFFTVLICGLWPALRLSGTDMHAAIKSGMRLGKMRHGGPRKALVAFQVALSLVLVVGAVLFTRTLENLASSSLGFHPNKVLVTRAVVQGRSGSRDFAPAWNRLLLRVRAFPGVEHASLASGGLFNGDPQLMGVRTTAVKALPSAPVTGLLFVSTGYFRTLGIHFIDGEDFGARDNEAGTPARVIVNQAFVHKFFGQENPLGRRVTKLANAPAWNEIVGIVQDAKYDSLRQGAPPMLYVPYGRIADWMPPQSRPGEAMFLQVEGRANTSSLAQDLRREFGTRFTFGETLGQQQLIDDTLVRERLLASVASLFGGLALLLAALGLYAVVSYAVVQRKQEIAIRIALGASRAAIFGLMLRDLLGMVAVGMVAGILAAAFGGQLARALLFGLAPDDPMTFVFAAALLLGASVVAAAVPVYRAATTDPMTALRYE